MRVDTDDLREVADWVRHETDVWEPDDREEFAFVIEAAARDIDRLRLDVKKLERSHVVGWEYTEPAVQRAERAEREVKARSELLAEIADDVVSLGKVRLGERWVRAMSGLDIGADDD